MKITKLITASGFFLATLALSSCQKDDLPGGNPLPEGAVHITAGIEGVQTRAPQLNADGAGTFEPTDEWGMYTFTGDAASPAYSNENIAYQANNSTPLLWKDLSETEAVTFSAHYPRITADIDDPAAYMYMPEKWNKTDDLLHATATATKGGTVALTFKHLMHRLVVNLAAGDGMEGVDLSSALINSVTKDLITPTMCARVEVNLLTGAVNYDRTDAGTIHSNGGGPKADWKVAPQDLTAGAEWLRIAVGEDGKDGVWYYHVPASLNSSNPDHPTRLESGKQLTLNLTLKKNPDTGNTVTLTGSDISGWDTQPPIDGNIDINGNGGTTGGVTTFEEFMAAIDAATGTEDNPTKITLGADVTLPFAEVSSVTLSANKHIEIDGGGYSLFPHMYTQAFRIEDGASLKLSNVTIDGQDAERNKSIIIIPTGGGNLTLGAGFKLTGAKMGASYPGAASCGIEAYGGTLVIEDGAEISGCGKGVAIQVANDCALRLKGGKVSGNSGYGLKLQSGSDSQPVDARIENTLPANARFENFVLGNYLYGPDLKFETVITAAPGYTLTAADLDKFTLKLVDSYPDSYELYLENNVNAIKLRKKN